MSTLIKCPACEREISPNATACPHCGEPRRAQHVVVAPPTQTATGCLAAILIGLILGGILYAIVVGLRW